MYKFYIVDLAFESRKFQDDESVTYMACLTFKPDLLSELLGSELLKLALHLIITAAKMQILSNSDSSKRLSLSH